MSSPNFEGVFTYELNIDDAVVDLIGWRPCFEFPLMYVFNDAHPAPEQIARYGVEDMHAVVNYILDFREDYPSEFPWSFDMAFDEEYQENSGGLCEESIMASLKTRVFGEQGSEEDDETCAICLCDYEENRKMGVLNCGHEFHCECIKKWLLQNNVCPMCRATALVLDK